MKHRLWAVLALAPIPAVYASAALNEPIAFLFLFYATVLIWLAVLFFLITGWSWKFLPAFFKIQDNGLRRFRWIALLCLAFFILTSWALSTFLLRKLPYPAGRLGQVGLLIFTFFLGWSSLRKNRRKPIIQGASVFILYVILLSVWGSWIHESTVPSSSVDELKSLPYAAWVPAKENIQEADVTKYDPSKVYEGWNLYGGHHLPEAYLIDMEGNRVHTWTARIGKYDYWHHVELDRNGDLFAIVKDKRLIRLDWDSNVRWSRDIPAHHDVAFEENGDVYVLTRRLKMVFLFGFPVPIFNDYIALLSPEGEMRKEISIFALAKDRVRFDSLAAIYREILTPSGFEEVYKGRVRQPSPLDIFHTNSIEVLGRPGHSLWKKGNLLISVLVLDLIGIVDQETEQIIWSWGPGVLDQQHHPTLLENGNFLIFDNGTDRNYSRIVELNPGKKEIVWEYKSDPPSDFYSGSRGASQRLPNGNTLITDSNSGRAFEITADGEIVWEFYNPDVDQEKNKRGAIYRMMRITDPSKYTKSEKSMGSIATTD